MAQSPSEAIYIEAADRAAGLAVPDGEALRFFASDPLFDPLEGRRFGSVTLLQQALRAVALEARRPSGRADSRGQVWRAWGRR
jgi:hypothetical protein